MKRKTNLDHLVIVFPNGRAWSYPLGPGILRALMTMPADKATDFVRKILKLDKGPSHDKGAEAKKLVIAIWDCADGEYRKKFGGKKRITERSRYVDQLRKEGCDWKTVLKEVRHKYPNGGKGQPVTIRALRIAHSRYLKEKKSKKAK
jgi:hypothetical protein